MATSVLLPGIRFGDYELLRKLESGGMGEIWKASQMHSGQFVALKFIKPHLLDDPENETRFLNEAKTLARLEHDRIVPLYGVCEDQGRLALILRFVDGESLARRIDRLGPLPFNLVLACARDVLPALGMAHENGIVHRDIKPQNILIDARERFLLSDFGIAVTEFAGRGTAEGTSLGTLHYMSPEQIEKPRTLDPHLGGHRSDIYSFGVVLFEMLTGRLPFGDRQGKADAFARIALLHCTAPPPRPREFNPDLGEAMEQVVLQCLEKNPDNRPQSCAELLKRLESAAASAPNVPAHSETLLEVRAVNHTSTVFLPGPAEGGSAVSVAARFRAAAPSAPAKAATVVKKHRKARGRKVVWIGLGAFFIAAAIGYGLLSRDQPLQPPTGGWEQAGVKDDALNHCRNEQQCLQRKAQRDKLLAVTDWKTEPDDSPLLRDCMKLARCEERSRTMLPPRTMQGPQATSRRGPPPPVEGPDVGPNIKGAGKLYGIPQ